MAWLFSPSGRTPGPRTQSAAPSGRFSLRSHLGRRRCQRRGPAEGRPLSRILTAPEWELPKIRRPLRSRVSATDPPPGDLAKVGAPPRRHAGIPCGTPAARQFGHSLDSGRQKHNRGTSHNDASALQPAQPTQAHGSETGQCIECLPTLPITRVNSNNS